MLGADQQENGCAGMLDTEKKKKKKQEFTHGTKCHFNLFLLPTKQP